MSWGARDVTVAFGDVLALAHVSLEVPHGRVTAVVGPDGAGKTTLLRCLVGACRVRSGAVNRPPATRVGYQPASSGVYPDLTVTENLDFVTRAFRMDPGVASARRTELLDVTGLGTAAGRLGSELSGGMRQKLGLAMALLHEPELLVLDEPSTGVDPVSRTEITRQIARTAAGGAAVVMSTTYLDEAERASSVLVLHDGRPLLSGLPEEIIAATAGSVWTVDRRPDSENSWRRGRSWRLWSPPGSAAPRHAVPAAADLTDAVIIAALGGGAT